MIDFDLDVQEVEQAIARSSEKLAEKIDWTKAWGKKYPILLQYPAQVNTEYYAAKLDTLLQMLREEYRYSELDAMLVLKDILAQVWKRRKSSSVQGRK